MKEFVTANREVVWPAPERDSAYVLIERVREGFCDTFGPTAGARLSH